MYFSFLLEIVARTLCCSCARWGKTI